MSVYTYDNNGCTFDCLYQALIFRGVYDAGIAMNGNMVIETAIGSEAACAAAVADSAPGTLFSNKVVEIENVQEKTLSLLSVGVETWSAGVYAELSKSLADEYFSDHQYFTGNPSMISATSPYIIYTIEGRGVSTSLTSDIKTLLDNSVARLKYVYTDALNSDGSKSEYQLITDILATTTQVQLDAIVDTRA